MRDGSDSCSAHRDIGCPSQFLGEPCFLPLAITLILRILMAGPVPMLAYVCTHAYFYSFNTNSFVSAWPPTRHSRLHSSLVTPHTLCSKPIPIHCLLIHLLWRMAWIMNCKCNWWAVMQCVPQPGCQQQWL